MKNERSFLYFSKQAISQFIILSVILFSAGIVFAEDEVSKTLQGVVFNDLDGDGSARESGEPGLEAWEVRVYRDDGNGWVLYGEALTNANGAFSITGLTIGTYRVCEVLYEGWVQTFATSKLTNTSPNKDTEGQWCVTRNVTTTTGTLTSVNFGNYQTITEDENDDDSNDSEDGIGDDNNNNSDGDNESDDSEGNDDDSEGENDDDNGSYATRGFGFWKTHSSLVREVFTHNFNEELILGVSSERTVNRVAQLQGLFVAHPTKKTDGSKRETLDIACVALAKQIVVTELNCEVFGCNNTTRQALADAQRAYSSEDIGFIRVQHALLETLNESGVEIEITVSQGANNQIKPEVDINFWDYLI